MVIQITEIIILSELAVADKSPVYPIFFVKTAETVERGAK